MDGAYEHDAAKKKAERTFCEAPFLKSSETGKTNIWQSRSGNWEKTQ